MRLADRQAGAAGFAGPFSRNEYGFRAFVELAADWTRRIFTFAEDPMLKLLVCVGAFVGVAAMGACSEGSAEKGGEKIDAAIDKATTGKENKGDGAFEKAGEAVDKATGQKDKDPVDAIHDATDGDKSTKPN